MSNQILIETETKKLQMHKDTFIRWLCLAEMIELTEEKAKELNVDLDRYDWVKPIAIKKYMHDRFKSMEIDLQAEEKEGGVELTYIDAPISNSPHIQEYHSETYQKQTSLTPNQQLEGKKRHAALE